LTSNKESIMSTASAPKGPVQPNDVETAERSSEQAGITSGEANTPPMTRKGQDGRAHGTEAMEERAKGAEAAEGKPAPVDTPIGGPPD
jgi:hypothetical protein